MRTFVLGDLHGGHKSLLQCLQRANFDYENDKLISLGDVADGWTEVVECFEEFFKMKNFVMVRGNHDQWLKEYLMSGKTPDVWGMQGGQNTLRSYEKHGKEVEKKHLEFLKTTKHWYLDEQNRLFVHGGLKIGVPLESQDKMDLMWDRSLLRRDVYVPEYREVYVGHSSVYRVTDKPLNIGNVWFMDTGGGWEGKLSMMDIDTKEVFQSDLVQSLYPNVKPR